MPTRRLPSESWMRPTTSKVREALVSSLQLRLPQARVLDLFAGTGSLGLACLKAGCSQAVFVEADRRSLKYLIDEVQRAGAEEPVCLVVHGKLPHALNRLDGEFDVILADPPYNSADGPLTLQNLQPFLAAGGIIVFEHHHKEDYPERCEELQRVKVKRYGETALSYWERRPVATNTDNSTLSS